ncbi:AAA family ATPase [Rudanella paleaurantiibacter]|uniref:Shikimate kinase n=1 Tax=Rudanella paleaurantiibacter TaxID=2614655 RepID=A0A7J5U0L3_9BACT|nr:shikimate kinase [Rudanella paleaurantiibacter]KAB7731185.1 AAA family ATPase [Rudanella paleaurantiibacter]
MKNIYLIGMPSSGKSTLGRRLANELHYRFVDTDKIIVREEGRSIAEIFAEQGEAYFREAETRALHSIRPGEALVVATGGGMPCFHNNMDYIKASGVSIFLDVAPEVLVERILAHATPDRPLVNHQDPALLENLRQKYESRLPYYRQADIIVTGSATEQMLLRELGNWL